MHDKRCVVPIEPEDVDLWLSAPVEDVAKLIRLAPADCFDSAPEARAFEDCALPYRMRLATIQFSMAETAGGIVYTAWRITCPSSRTTSLLSVTASYS